MNIIELKKRLDALENIQLHNGDDLAVVGRCKITNRYVFVFNTRALFSYRTFSIFAKKANEKVRQYYLTELQD